MQQPATERLILLFAWYSDAMETIASSVRITGDANGVLSKLAAKLGQSKAQVIQTALQQMEERVFWAEVQEAFAREEASTEERVESARWDRASDTDFRDEKW